MVIVIQQQKMNIFQVRQNKPNHAAIKNILKATVCPNHKSRRFISHSRKYRMWVIEKSLLKIVTQGPRMLESPLQDELPQLLGKHRVRVFHSSLVASAHDPLTRTSHTALQNIKETEKHNSLMTNSSHLKLNCLSLLSFIFYFQTLAGSTKAGQSFTEWIKPTGTFS